jgi:hypothetical protein
VIASLLFIAYEKGENINNFLLGNYNNNKGGRNKGIMLIWCDLISDGVGNNIIRRKERQKKVERDVENIRYIHCRLWAHANLQGALLHTIC